MEMVAQSIIARLFGEVLDRTGLADSIVNQCQRCACVMTRGKVAAPPPGAPLLVDLAGIVEHSGIYLGDGRVAELFGENLLREVPLKEFLEGAKGSRTRTGRRIFAACSKSSGATLASRYAAENARAFIRTIRTVDYDLLRNNCHLFTISCISGNFQKGITVGDAIRRGGVSIGALAYAVGYFLNGGGDVVWKPVEGWDRESLKASGGADLRRTESDGAFGGYVEKTECDRAKCEMAVAGLEGKMEKASVRNGIFAPCLEYVKLAYGAVRDSLSGKRSDIPWPVICWVVAALVYFISPLDLVPDFVPVAGYADDAAFLIRAFWELLPYIDIPVAVARRIMRIDGDVERWIKSLAPPGGRLADAAAQAPTV